MMTEREHSDTSCSSIFGWMDDETQKEAVDSLDSLDSHKTASSQRRRSISYQRYWRDEVDTSALFLEYLSFFSSLDSTYGKRAERERCDRRACVFLTKKEGKRVRIFLRL